METSVTSAHSPKPDGSHTEVDRETRFVLLDGVMNWNGEEGKEKEVR